MMFGPSSLECWNDIIRRGRKSSTYKIAMGFAVCRFVDEGKRHVTSRELAEVFLDLYTKRLENGMPQLSDPNHRAVMETIVGLIKSGSLSQDEAIDRVSSEAFSDVIPSFHTVDGCPVSMRFFERYGSGIVITDNAYELFRSLARASVLSEMDVAWSELEWSFSRNRALRHSSVWVSSIGSRQDSRIRWCAGDINAKSITKRGQGIQQFADGIAEDLSNGRKVALGFECPLSVRIPESLPSPSAVRLPENPSSCSGGTTRIDLLAGMVQVAWVLKTVRNMVPRAILPTLDSTEFASTGHDLLLWEAFVSPERRLDTCVGGAEPAVRAFFSNYAQLVECAVSSQSYFRVENIPAHGAANLGTVPSAERFPERTGRLSKFGEMISDSGSVLDGSCVPMSGWTLSLVGVSLLWAGFEVAPDVLRRPCLVICE